MYLGFPNMLFSLSIFRSQVDSVTQGLLHSIPPEFLRDQSYREAAHEQAEAFGVFHRPDTLAAIKSRPEG